MSQPSIVKDLPAIALMLCALSACGPRRYIPDLTIWMSAAEVELKCGKPWQINADSWGNDQWVYDLSHYVYTRDGKLASWQSPR
jgi:hypothetical protein